MAGDYYKGEDYKKRVLRDKHLIKPLNELLDDSKRKIETTTKLKYNDAGDATITIERIGEWTRNGKGEWQLIKLSE